MEAAVEVALPASVELARLMGSPEGFGSGGVVVGEVRWHMEGACSSGDVRLGFEDVSEEMPNGIKNLIDTLMHFATAYSSLYTTQLMLARKMIFSDDIHAFNVSAPAFWEKIPDSEVRLEVSHQSSLESDDVVNDHGSGNMKSHPLTLHPDAKPVRQKSGKIARKNSGCTKRSGMVQMEVSNCKSGLHDVNGTFPELASSSASCNISVQRNNDVNHQTSAKLATLINMFLGKLNLLLSSVNRTFEMFLILSQCLGFASMVVHFAQTKAMISEKHQLVKQKNSSISRRGDKRNSKFNQKSRCDSFSLKNGLVGFNSAAGGNNFIGIYGLKPDVFDITKYVDEPSVDELLRGGYSCPFIAKDKGKKAATTNSDILQSVRNACSVLQSQKVLQTQNSAETDNSLIRKDSTGSVALSSAVVQTDGIKEDSCSTDLPSSQKVHESDDKIKMADIADSSLYKPKDILERLSLPPPKDLDLLLSDASKTTTSSKNSTDPRLGKLVSQRTGLPPFPWSHSFSGHNKLGSDAVKLSTSRTICQGRWVKVKNFSALQKGSVDLLKDFESLTFDQSLVPSISDRPENDLVPVERVLSASGACSPSKVLADEYSTTHTAAQTLLDMAAYSKKNPCATVKLLKKPSQMAMKASKLKSIDKKFEAPKSTRPNIPLKVRDDGFSSKKPRLSTDVTNAFNFNHTDRKATVEPSSLFSFKSPPRKKLFRDSNANTGSYGINLVKKSCVIETPRGTDRPSSSKQKFWKSSQ
ncbi:hypothetical protein DH2020_036268 [Rehmannia glutinosa]|uniref:Uncharacterized protein n=1 Tax=Rehmannia glutinosa TaxID=99300 RepID=A0ABR0V7A8_REHGL